MLEQVEKAIGRKDYRTARNLLKTLVHNQPDNELAHFYAAQLQELTDHLDNAEKLYRNLLKDSVDPTILKESRRALARVQAAKAAKVEASRSAALDVEGGREYSLLILESVTAEAKTEMAPKLGEIMNVDPYTARLHLPSRGWRLYRSGFQGDLQVYQGQLQNAGIPSFCTPLGRVNDMEVVTVQVIEEFRPQAIVCCHNDYGAEMRMGFLWPEVTSIVTGLLPIFEELNEVTASATKKTIERKPKVLDYVQLCDLHVPSKNLIFRMSSENYAYQKADGEKTGDFLALTSRENWQRLLNQIYGRTVQAKMFSEFTPFAETALGCPELLQKVTHHLNLMRRKESLWDNAFQLYSGLIFCKTQAAMREAELN
jgi:hypothetical protein